MGASKIVFIRQVASTLRVELGLQLALLLRAVLATCCAQESLGPLGDVVIAAVATALLHHGTGSTTALEGRDDVGVLIDVEVGLLSIPPS